MTNSVSSMIGARPQPGIGRILVATDFTLDGDRAVRRAALLPLRPGARITLVHVLPRRLDRSTDAVVRGRAEQELEATGRGGLARLFMGSVAEAVLQHAADRPESAGSALIR